MILSHFEDKNFSWFRVLVSLKSISEWSKNEKIFFHSCDTPKLFASKQTLSNPFGPAGMNF